MSADYTELETNTRALEAAQAQYLQRVAPGCKQRRIQWSSGTTQVLETGQGPVLLFVHGGLGEAFQYAPLFQHFAPRYRLLAVDRPGHGLADPINYDGVNLLEHSATFLRDAIDGEGLDKVTLVASSMGGLWSLNYALLHPDKVRQVILLGSPAGITRDIPPMLRLGTLPILRNIVHALMRKPTVASVRDFWKQMLVVNADKLDRDFLEASVASQARNAPSWFTLIDAAMNARGLRPYLLLGERWRSLQVPVTCIWGDQDVWARPALAAGIAAMTPLFKTIVIPNAGHVPWFDDQEAVLRAMDTVLV